MIIFGCPGWLQGAIQASQMIRCGDAKVVMVIGAETLSNIIDKYDRDSMIFSDGAGATIFKASESENGYLSSVQELMLIKSYLIWKWGLHSIQKLPTQKGDSLK